VYLIQAECCSCLQPRYYTDWVILALDFQSIWLNRPQDTWFYQDKIFSS